MAELIIPNPSITTNVFEYDEAGRVSAISGHPLAGEGGGTVVKSDLMWKPTVGSDGYVHWTLASSATTPEAAYISGAQGPQGPSGTNGKDGTNGISPTFTIAPTAGGTHVTISGAQGKDSFDVLSGAKGADGYSPTVSTTTTASEDRTGTVLTFTYGDEGGQTVSYTAWNGKDGTGATVDLLEGTGIQITHAGTTYTISVSADYALKSELPDLSPYATKTYTNDASAYALSQAESWVGQQGYLTSIPDTYATKTYANDASANALSEAKTWVGDQGFLKSTDLTDYATKTYVDTASAEALSQAKTWVEKQSYLHTSGGTVSGKLTVSGSDFDNSLEIIRGGSDTSASTGQIGINGAGGLSFKIKRGNNNTQLNIAPNATMDKRFSIGDSPYSPAAYLIPAVTATTTAGLTDDGILHIIVEN